MRDLLRRLLAALRPQRRYPAVPWWFCPDCGSEAIEGTHRHPMVLNDPMDGVQPPDPRPVQTAGELPRRTR